MPTINPQSLATLKRASRSIPGVDDVQVSPDVMEAAPDLSLDTPKTAYGFAGNEQLKRMLGLDQRSPEFQQQEADIAARDKALNDARIAQDPEVSAEADKAYQEKLGIAGEGARVAGEEAQKLEGVKHADTMDFLGGNGAGGGVNSPTSPFKTSINANGEATFAPNEMPALMQRGHEQLSDAYNKTSQALQDAERLYPGIIAAAQQADQRPDSPGWMSVLTGDAGKYGGAADLVGARNERLKYSMGMPTPFSKLAQEASFGNIEQMAGQLPGVRGLSMLTGLFKDHQSRWGYETPLATVQRLLHMQGIMTDTLSNMEVGGGSAAQRSAQSNNDPWAAPPTAAELAGGR